MTITRRRKMKALSLLMLMIFLFTTVIGAPLLGAPGNGGGQGNNKNDDVSLLATSTDLLVTQVKVHLNQIVEKREDVSSFIVYLNDDGSVEFLPDGGAETFPSNTNWVEEDCNILVHGKDVAILMVIYWKNGETSSLTFNQSNSNSVLNITKGSGSKLVMPQPQVGSVTIDKVITGDDLPEGTITFSFDISGPNDYSNTISIDNDGYQTLSGLAPGTYTISESNLPTNFAEAQNNPTGFTIVADQTATVTFTNIYTKPQSNPHKGSLTITKSFDKKGDTPPEDSVFTFKIKDDIHGYSYEETITITGEDSYTIYNLKPGKYTVEETKLPQHFSVVGSKTQKVTVVKGEDREVTFVNKYSPPKAPLTITKVYDPESDESAPQDTVFTFKIKDNIPHYHFEKTVTITGEGSVDIWEIWPGDYTVEEILIPENFDLVGNNPQSVKVEKWKYKEVIFTNLYEEPYIPPTTGSLELTKVLPENFDGDSATFVFCITEPLLTLKSSQENAVASLCGYTLTIEYDGTPESLTEVLPELPEGYYLIEEIEMPDGFSPAEGNADGFFITIGETTKLNFANDYEEPETGIKIIKQLTGDTAPSNSTFEFTIKPAEQNGGPVDSYRVLLFSDQVESITYNGNADSLEKTIELPAGSYTVEETKWPDRFTPQDAGPKNVLVIEGEISNVIFINDYDAPPTITGGGGGGTSYYNLTINYLEVGTNDVLAPAYSTSMASASAYDVSDRTDDAIDGYVWDSISGDPTSGYIYSNLVINVYYTAEEILEEEEPPLGPIPEEEPQPIPEDEPDEIIVLEDETPLGDLPKTGTSPSPAAPAYLVPKEMELSFKEEDEE